MKLSYLQQGFGSNFPLVLLHPYPLNAHFWKNQLSGISRQRHVIAPNFRGYGATPADAGDHFSVEMFASDVRKTLHNLKIPKAVFAGCSLGGYVLFELWRQDPDLIAGMAFIDTRAEADTEEGRAKRMDSIQKIRETGNAMIPDVAAGLLSETTRKARPDVEREVKSWAAKPDCDTLIKSIELLAKRPDSQATLPTIDVPTLVVVGEEDTVTPVSSAEIIANGVENGSLVKIPEAGHLSPLENPLAVNQALSEFLPTIS